MNESQSTPTRLIPTDNHLWNVVTVSLICLFGGSIFGGLLGSLAFGISLGSVAPFIYQGIRSDFLLTRAEHHARRGRLRTRGISSRPR